MRRRLTLAVVLAAVAALLAATYAGAGGSGSAQAAVTVTLRDFKFVQPKLNPGQTTITFKNTGKFDHNYTVVYRSKGGSKFASKDVKPGASSTMSVNLKPGAYTVLCTIFNGAHVAQGMVKHFSVGKIDFNTGKWGP